MPTMDANVYAPAQNKLEIIFSNRPVPKPDGKNIWIDIDINLAKLTALFHCQHPEHVGNHKKRMVTYRADHDCVLRFTKPEVFNMEWVQLIAYKDVVLRVNDETANAETSYEIYTGTATPAEGTRMVTYSLTGPHIVVP
jgi:hypothetical protein